MDIVLEQRDEGKWVAWESGSYDMYEATGATPAEALRAFADELERRQAIRSSYERGEVTNSQEKAPAGGGSPGRGGVGG